MKNNPASIRKSSKTGLLGSKSKVLRDRNGYIKDDTFDTKQKNINKNQNTVGDEDFVVKRNNPHNYKTKNTLKNYNKIKEGDMSCTLDSARDSAKSSSEVIKEFMEAAANGNRDRLDTLLRTQKITDVNCTDVKDKTALHYAVNEGRAKTAGFLLNNKANPNINGGQKKETALHIACRKAYKKIIVLLLNHNADPNSQDANGKTCLHVVAGLSSREHVVAFINHCKSPINWSLEDSAGKRAMEVPTSSEIKRLLSSYMKTATAQRFSRETRINNMGAKRGVAGSDGRSRSKESGSISKRQFTQGK